MRVFLSLHNFPIRTIHERHAKQLQAEQELLYKQAGNHDETDG